MRKKFLPIFEKQRYIAFALDCNYLKTRRAKLMRELEAGRSARDKALEQQ